MTRTDFYHFIELPKDIIDFLEIAKDSILNNNLIPWDDMMDSSNAQAAYQTLIDALGEDPGNFKMLYCQLECARRIQLEYKKHHINMNIYQDTMKCFSRFIKETKCYNPTPCYDRSWWTYRQISMQLFRIGDMEYELTTIDGAPVISIHIPSDAVFTKEVIDRSLADAKQFFCTYYPKYHYSKFVCNSWLLSPTLGTLLSEHSHILDFQKRFQITKNNPKDNGFILWIFQVPVDTDYINLPENTSLQQTVKKYLIAGGSIGSANGFIPSHDIFQGTL